MGGGHRVQDSREVVQGGGWGSWVRVRVRVWVQWGEGYPTAVRQSCASERRGVPVTPAQIRALLAVLPKLGTRCFRVKKSRKDDGVVSLLQYASVESGRSDLSDRHINNLLYSLEKPGLATKEPDVSPPVWALTAKGLAVISLYNHRLLRSSNHVVNVVIIRHILA